MLSEREQRRYLKYRTLPLDIGLQVEVFSMINEPLFRRIEELSGMSETTQMKRNNP